MVSFTFSTIPFPWALNAAFWPLLGVPTLRFAGDPATLYRPERFDPGFLVIRPDVRVPDLVGVARLPTTGFLLLPFPARVGVR